MTPPESNTLNRRSALQLLGLGAASLALPRLASSMAAAPAGPPAAKWKTAIGLNGFQSGTAKYQKKYLIWEILEFAARHKFEGVELVPTWPYGDYPQPSETHRIDALRRMYEAFGLRVFSIQIGAGGAFAPQAEERAKWLREFRAQAGFAKLVGADCVGLWPGGSLRGQTVDEGLQRLVESFREAAKIAADLGLIAAFEIEPPFSFNTEGHYQRILHGVSHPSLKGIYDPSHFDLMTGAKGKPEEMLRRVGVDNIGYVQFTDGDSTLRDGGTSKHLACGDGKLDVALSLRLLREGGFRGWIMIDEWEIPDVYDACVKGKKALDAAWPE